MSVFFAETFNLMSVFLLSVNMVLKSESIPTQS